MNRCDHKLHLFNARYLCVVFIEAMSYTKVADQTREMKEAAFLKKVQQKEKTNHICWCVAPCDYITYITDRYSEFANNIIW